MAEEPGPREPVRLAIDLGALHTVAVIRRQDAERLGQLDPGGFDPHPKRSIDHGSVLLGRHEYPPAEVIGAVFARVAAARRAGLHVAALVDEPVAAGAYCLSVLDVPVGRSVMVFDLGGGLAVRRQPAQQFPVPHRPVGRAGISGASSAR